MASSHRFSSSWNEHPNIELHHLRHLVAVANHSTLSAAADSVCVTQSALSKSIARLEDRIGARLFDRVGRRLVLNELGRRVVLRARPLLQQAVELDNEILRWRDGQLGTVAIGVGPMVEQLLLPEVLKRFVREQPDVPIVVRTGSTEVLLELLRDDQLHLLVTDYEVDPSIDDLEVERLAPERLFAAVAADHPCATHTELSLEDLIAHPIIAPTPPLRFTQLVRKLVPDRAILSPHLQCDSYELLIGVAEHSRSIVLGPEPLVRRYAVNRAVVAVPIAFEVPALQPSVMSRRNYTIPPVTQRVRELFSRVGGRLGREPDPARSE